MILLIALLLSVGFLAYSNGANENFKGVVTLFGSRTTSYRKAFWRDAGTTLAGSLTAVFLCGQLIKTFNGKGLVDEALRSIRPFLLQ